LADLVTPLHFVDLSSAVWASLIWWSKKEFDDGAARANSAVAVGRLRRNIHASGSPILAASVRLAPS
jgi:hypothetical protein